jgi:hypothetical protein
MKARILYALLVIVPELLFASTAANATITNPTPQRAYVSAAIGNDANNCGYAAPCRTIQVALTQVNPGGEILVLDSGGYGCAANCNGALITISQSVSIVAPPGIYAGISPATGVTGILITSSGLNVNISGLTINSQGSVLGISVPSGTGLRLKNAEIANFSTTNATAVSSVGGIMEIANVYFHDNYVGVNVTNNGTANISHSTFSNHSGVAVYVVSTTSGVTASGISDSMFSDNNYGVAAYSLGASTSAEVAIIRTTLSDGNYGAISQANLGTSVVSLSACMVAGNLVGLWQNPTGGAAIMSTFGDNEVFQNTTNVQGSLTTVLKL